jgi:hypothetical protein
MSFFKLRDDDKELFTLVTHVPRHFSSIMGVVTGSLQTYVRTNRIIKDVDRSLVDSAHFDEVAGVAEKLKTAQEMSGTNISGAVTRYIAGVEAEALSARLNSSASVSRTTPGYVIDNDFMRKRVIIDSLMSHYRSIFPTAEFSVGNYNCLNFFTASGLSNSTAILYPVSYSAGQPQQYVPTAGFTVDFHLKPNMAPNAGDVFTAGTVLHISSTLALSLVTGSYVDPHGRKTGYRMLLQLSHSADFKPSTVDLTIANGARSFPRDLIFMSDEVISFNEWCHVAVRWGTNSKNHGSGTFVIDGTEAGTFNVPSASVTTIAQKAGALVIGNYFDALPSVDMRDFFNDVAKLNEGVTQLSTADDPSAYSFAHPLNAELHHVRVTPRFMGLSEIVSASDTGTATVGDASFYLPVMFVSESRNRNFSLLHFTLHLTLLASRITQG